MVPEKRSRVQARVNVEITVPPGLFRNAVSPALFRTDDPSPQKMSDPVSAPLPV